MKKCLYPDRTLHVFYPVIIVLFLMSLLWTSKIDAYAAEKKVTATITKESVTVGKQIHIETKMKDVRYTSSDPVIATVSDEGVITGKKAGKVVIAVKKSGYQTKKFEVAVNEYGKYPSIPVTLDETGIELEYGGEELRAVIGNCSETGSIKKIEYIYDAYIYHSKTEENGEYVDDETTLTVEDEDTGEILEEEPDETEECRRVTIRAGKIGAGEEKEVTVKGDFGDPDLLDMELLRVRIYTGKAVLSYNMSNNRMSVKWQIKDTTPPVVSGWAGSDGYNAKDVFMVAYSDREYDFLKYVHASDNMGGKVKLTVDTGKINWKKSGIYEITYTATDLAGNETKKSAKVQVRAVNDLDRMADSILKNIVKDSWSDQQKAEAIYRYMRKNYSYVDSNDHESWEKSALYGLRYQSGNCFVFYSVSRLLLTRCGIPNIEVKRSAGSRHGHWWNYVYIDGGWYHFDTTPRRRRATFCLVTDDQLSAYSRAAGNSHIWDKSLIPKGATKKINSVKWGKSY